MRVIVSFRNKIHQNFSGEQVRIRAHSAGGHVLPLIFYSDGAELERNGRKFHPLLLYIGSFSLANIRSKGGFMRIALLPILDADKIGFKGDTKRYTSIASTI